MPDKIPPLDPSALLAAWTKRCYLAGRVAMEAALRPYDLGATQWFVLYHLSRQGPTRQRDLPKILEVERATLSTVVAVMVRKGLIEQVPDKVDQRQKHLRMTARGESLWAGIPDLSFIHRAAFDGLDPSAIATTIGLLERAVQRLERLSGKGADT